MRSLIVVGRVRSEFHERMRRRGSGFVCWWLGEVGEERGGCALVGCAFVVSFEDGVVFFPMHMFLWDDR